MDVRPDKTATLGQPSLVAATLHLAAFWTLALVQPLLNLLGNNPEFFVARDDTGFQTAIFVILLTVLPPALAGLTEWLVGLVSRSVRWILHLALVTLLCAMIAMQLLKQFAAGPVVPMVLLAILLGVLVARAYATRRFVRSLAEILVIAPPVVLAVFFFFSPSSSLFSSHSEAEAKQVTVGRPAPVVMIIFDELPAGSLMTPGGEVNAKRFPNFSELAETGTWYRNNSSNASYTAIAVPSLLTGTKPDRHALPTTADHPDSIFTLLGGSYRIRAIEPITQICPDQLCENSGLTDRKSTLSALGSLADDLRWVSAHLVLPKDAGPSLPDISETFADFGGQRGDDIDRGPARQWARDRLDRGEADLDGESMLAEYLKLPRERGRRTLDMLHIEEPHIPWNHYPSGQSYSLGDEDFRNLFDDKTWFADRYMTDRGAQAHLLETGFADSLLGRVIDRLKAEGRWDKSLVVVTSDHGGSIRPGLPRRSATPQTAGTIGLVPLFIKAPGQTRGRTVDRPSCSTMIVPEIARILKVRLDWKAGECDREKLQIDNGTGPLVTVPFARAIAQRSRYVNRLARLFGGDTGWNDVLRLGPNRNLVGRSADSFGRLPQGGAGAKPEPDSAQTVTWNPQESLNRVLRQRGSLTQIDPGQPLAVVVNGVIAAVGESFSELGRVRYSILLPQWSLSPGRNRVEIYAIEQGRFRPLAER